MHLTILFGAFMIVVLGVPGIESTTPILVVFLLKTAPDPALHTGKHPGEF